MPYLILKESIYFQLFKTKSCYTHTQGKIWYPSRIFAFLMFTLIFTQPTWSQSYYCGHTVPASLKFFETGDNNLVSSAFEAKKSRNGIPVISNICNDENGFTVYVKCTAGDEIGLDISVTLALNGHFEITGTSGFYSTPEVSETSVAGRITRAAPGNYEEYCASFTVNLKENFVLNGTAISFAVTSKDHLANDNFSGTGLITFLSLVAADDLLVDEYTVYSSATSASTLISTNVIDDLACFQPLSKLLYFKDDLTIDVDACFDPGNVEFEPKIYFAPGKKMVVQTSKTAKLRIAELGTCEVDKWTGIEGAANSIVDLDDVTIDNALIGINTYNTKLDIKNSEFKNSGTGIRAYGGTDVLMFDNNHLHDLDIGIVHA